MPRRSLKQDSFFDPQFVCPDCLQEGTVAWLLARHRSKLFPDWLVKGWRGEGRRGRNAWPPKVLMTLVLLRFTERSISRRASCRRANTDMQWRAAMGVACDVKPPDEKTVRNFEAFLRSRHPEAGVKRFVLFHEHIVRLCRRAEVLEDERLWVCDSTPMWCYGAVVDTVRMLGEGVVRIARQYAEARRIRLSEVLSDWGIDWADAPSIKGAFDINWKDADARGEVLEQLGTKAVEIVDEVRTQLHQLRKGKTKKLLKLCRHLMKVVEQNLERTQDGRLQIADGVATGRLISLTDPQARHGRKSDSRKFNGFKLHLLGDAISGLITSLTVTPGNAHDGEVAGRLIRRAKQLSESMHTLLGDTAYGSASLRKRAERQWGVQIIAPPNKQTDSGERLGKNDFEVDVDEGWARCPNGVVSKQIGWVKYPDTHNRKAPRFLWPKQHCEDCPLKDRCSAVKKSGSSRVVFHPDEQALRRLRADWEQPETRQSYRKRSQGERLVNETVRRGARKAMAWGLGSAELQAYVIVMVNNLSLLAKALANDSTADVFDAAG